MNLKKISAALLSCVMAGTLFTGCGGGDNKTVRDDPQTQIGLISKLNASEEELNNRLKKLEEVANRPNMKFSHDYHYYDGINSLVMAIKADQVEEDSTYESVANYLVSKNIEFKILDHTVNMSDSFCCAVRKEDTALLDSINSAIQSMKDDGTLDNLTKTYITDLNLKENPPAVKIEQIDGADTIKVGITGDLPPLDLILPDGTPAGFNTAMLAEIGKRINKNIEIVQIESNARAVALTSKKIDLVFWVTIPGEFWKGTETPNDIDKPAELETTMPYFEDKIVHVTDNN